MAFDYVVGGLQVISIAVNGFAMAAFWVSGGLQTTANRFVINLLIVNVFSCLALTPTFLGLTSFGSWTSHDHYELAMTSTLSPDFVSRSDSVIEEASESHNWQLKGMLEMGVECSGHDCRERSSPNVDDIQATSHRIWGFDLAAALGECPRQIPLSFSLHSP